MRLPLGAPGWTGDVACSFCCLHSRIASNTGLLTTLVLRMISAEHNMHGPTDQDVGYTRVQLQ